MGCLWSADGTCTSHSFKHHQAGQQLNAQDAFHVALPHCEKSGKEMARQDLKPTSTDTGNPKGFQGSKFISKFFLSSRKQL